MLDFILGKTFWSTVIRSALFFPLLTVISLPLILLFGNAEDIAEIRSMGLMMWGITGVWGFLFGSWVGWGFAYWRFTERPVGKGMFATYPLVTGLIAGPVFWVFSGYMSRLDPAITELGQEMTGEQVTATIFGLIVGHTE